MIKGMHGLFYTPQHTELREFIRRKLRFPFTDTGDGWLIFDLPESDLGVHPADHAFHSLSFYCDDIFKTVDDLKGRGVEFTSHVSEQSWGWITRFRMPGDIEVELYQPKYRKSTRNPNAKAKNAKQKPKSRQRKSKSKS